MYDILFKAVSKTLIGLGKDKEHIGAQLGFIALLHTWGQNLMHHPHIHCIVPGGGLSEGTNKWISSKKKFLIHVKVLSSHFKRNFIKLLKKAYYKDKLNFIGEITNLGQKYIETFTQYQKLNAYEFMLKIKGIDISVCPCYGSGKMITKSEMLPKNCSPPVYYWN